ncbi:Uncharacterized [Moorella glycerini]|uniref:Uncharacterized protein n=1 Tax=Neomoorella stamsii TaxID=1266720 RepID=A0A9X7P510_9FIRM|nr:MULTISPECIES: hypothetical protein [Moorella]PRR69633.1 hypothetical protein MOST_30550 [Moorella stamsii]CEP67843.1 Uncharacterized [Moorella glycerini]
MAPQTFDIDMSLGLTPDEMEHILNHPVVIAAARKTLQNPDLREEAARLSEEVIQGIRGYQVPAVIFGLIDALSTFVANIDHQVKANRNKPSRFKVIMQA